MYGDNLGMLQSSTMPEGTLKKKWEAISFHMVREGVAAGIIVPRKIPTEENIADALTKALPAPVLLRLSTSVYVEEQVTGKRKRS